MALSCLSVMSSGMLTPSNSVVVSTNQILRHEFLTVDNSFSTSYPLANTNNLGIDSVTSLQSLKGTNSIPSSVSINPLATGITITLRVRQTALNYDPFVFYNIVNSKNGGGDQSGFFRIAFSQGSGAGNFHFTYSSTNDNMQQHLSCYYQVPAVTSSFNLWTVTLTPSNSNRTITATYYFNTTRIVSGIVSSYNSTNTSNWANLCNMGQIGLLQGAHTGTGAIKGVIRDFRIYSKALSASEITQIYNGTLI
jgi:hypothetical protein